MKIARIPHQRIPDHTVLAQISLSIWAYLIYTEGIQDTPSSSHSDTWRLVIHFSALCIEPNAQLFLEVFIHVAAEFGTPKTPDNIQRIQHLRPSRQAGHDFKPIPRTPFTVNSHPPQRHRHPNHRQDTD
jgi:hypothetical protein